MNSNSKNTIKVITRFIASSLHRFIASSRCSNRMVCGDEQTDLVKRQLQKTRARDEVAERELKIDQFRNQIKDNHTALKTHGNLLEAAQSQYNVYRKKSTEQ